MIMRIFCIEGSSAESRYVSRQSEAQRGGRSRASNPGPCDAQHSQCDVQSLGFSYDWKREVSTTDEKYYKWTQWIFLQLFNKGLAYQAEVPVNWCPALGTVLANEEVIDGKSERGDHPVYRKNLKQVGARRTYLRVGRIQPICDGVY